MVDTAPASAREMQQGPSDLHDVDPSGMAEPASQPGTSIDFKPRLAPGVILLGQMQDSGFAESMWLVQIEGRFIQLTELLYRTAERCDGQHTLEGIAEEISGSTEWKMNADDADFLVRERLLPIGIVLPGDQVTSDLPSHPTTAPSMLRLGLRRRVITAEMIEPVARRLQHLFNPLLLIPLATLGAMAHAWLYLDRGIGGLLSNTLYTPGLLLVVFVMTIVPGFWHEFGHASALRYGGGRSRGIGVGIYIMDPAFYTDTTDSYRLGRWARIRTGLGGIYFDTILSTCFIAAYVLTGAEFLIVLVVLNNINTLYQFFPLIRLDGYWVLADLTGVPDFYSMMGSFIRSVVPFRRWKGQRLPNLKPWVKGVFALYTLIAIPSLVVFMTTMLLRAPDIARLAWDALAQNASDIPAAWRDGDWINAAALVSQVLLLAITLVGLAYFLLRLARTILTIATRLVRLLIERYGPATRAAGAQ